MKHSDAKLIALALAGILLLLSVGAGAYFRGNILAATAKIQYRLFPTQRSYCVYHIRSAVDENYARYYEESVELIPVISKEVFREQPGNNNFPRNYPSAFLFLTDFAILSAGGQEDYAKKLFLQFYPQLDEAVQRVWAQKLLDWYAKSPDKTTLDIWIASYSALAAETTDNACRIQCLSDIALLKKAVYAFSGVRVVTDNADLRALSGGGDQIKVLSPDSGETLVFSISAGDWITDAV